MADHRHADMVAEHFESAEKQEHAAKFGMWVFLGSETLLFGALFGLYAAYRSMYGADFLEASHHNYMSMGTINTVVLIVSSFFVAWAVHSVRHDRFRAATWCLLATIGLALVFLVIKLVEYGLHFEEGIYPGSHYSFEGLPGEGAKMFFTMYYFLSGLHALHVVAGVIILTWLLVRVRRRTVTPHRHTALELGGLYWHLVDVIWIFLWPLLYLA